MKQILSKWVEQNIPWIAISPVIQIWFNWKKLVENILSDPEINWDISYKTAVSHREKFVEEFGIEEYSTLLRKIIWESKVKISFEDFSEFLDLRNNFRAYFSPQTLCYESAYRIYWFYQRFEQNHPDLVQKLISIYNRPNMAFYQETHEEFELLYRAYELMLEDEEVTMNKQLFR